MNEHLVDFVVTLYFTSLCFNALCSGKISIVNFIQKKLSKNFLDKIYPTWQNVTNNFVKMSGLVNDVTKNGVRVSKNDKKVAIFAIFD